MVVRVNYNIKHVVYNTKHVTYNTEHVVYNIKHVVNSNNNKDVLGNDVKDIAT